MMKKERWMQNLRGILCVMLLNSFFFYERKNDILGYVLGHWTIFGYDFNVIGPFFWSHLHLLVTYILLYPSPSPHRFWT